MSGGPFALRGPSGFVRLVISRIESSARAHAERAVSVREAANATPTLLAEARFVLAQALWSDHNEQPRARALAEQAQEALATADDPARSTVDLDEIDDWLATHHPE
ncbi:MAG: hypothetical protein AAGF11_37250 [Myxococcota bacterium]